MLNKLRTKFYKLNVKGCLALSKALRKYYVLVEDKKMIKQFDKDIKYLESILERLENGRNK